LHYTKGIYCIIKKDWHKKRRGGERGWEGMG